MVDASRTRNAWGSVGGVPRRQRGLYSLSESCAALLDATACGVLLMDSAGDLELTAATDLDIRALEAFEATARQGPCFDAYRSGETIVRRDIRECHDR